MQTRKDFIKSAICLTGIGALIQTKAIADFSFLDYQNIYFDLHSHAGWNFARKNFTDNADGAMSKVVNNLKEGQVNGVFFAIVADAGLLKPTANGISVTGKYQSGEGWNTYKKQVLQLKIAFEKSGIQFETKVKEMIPENQKSIGLIAVEGGDFLEGSFNNLEESYQDGVRSIQLVHYAPNEIGDLQTADNIHNGLSLFGKELVKKMNSMGIVIDVAHASFDTCKAVASISKSPLLLSHSILEMEADRPMAKRAISKEHAKLIAETGGIIGAWPSGFNKNFDEYIDNIKRLVDTVGINHVGIGTDMEANFKPVLKNYNEFPKISEALISKGFSKNETGKIMGDNAKKMLSKILK